MATVCVHSCNKDGGGGYLNSLGAATLNLCCPKLFLKYHLHFVSRYQ